MAESLFCLQWDVALQAVILHKKRWDINIYEPLIMVMIKSTSMNPVNVLVRFNKLLWYFCSFPHIQYLHWPSYLPLRKKNSGFENTFFFSFHLPCGKNENLWWFSSYPVRSCNYNNDMAYNWPNSAFFNFQKNADQENCRQYSCILFFIDKLEQKTLPRESLSLNRFFLLVGQ